VPAHVRPAIGCANRSSARSSPSAPSTARGCSTCTRDPERSDWSRSAEEPRAPSSSSEAPGRRHRPAQRRDRREGRRHGERPGARERGPRLPPARERSVRPRLHGSALRSRRRRDDGRSRRTRTPALADALVVVERARRSTPPDFTAAGLELFREKSYGDTTLWWAEPATDESASRTISRRPSPSPDRDPIR
jgi:hypothetical protein